MMGLMSSLGAAGARSGFCGRPGITGGLRRCRPIAVVHVPGDAMGHGFEQVDPYAVMARRLRAAAAELRRAENARRADLAMAARLDRYARAIEQGPPAPAVRGRRRTAGS
jgi:hypothetical protein